MISNVFLGSTNNSNNMVKTQSTMQSQMQMMSQQNQSTIIKTELEDSIKRKREDDDYDVP